MPNLRTLTLLLAVLIAQAAYALAPTDGHIVGNSYVNTYFHFSYAWPAMLKPMPLPAPAADTKGPNAYAFPLFTARTGDQPYGLTLVAEKLNVAGPHSDGIKNSADYIGKIASSLRPGPILSNITQTQKKNAHGVVFDELNYLQSGKPSSVMATQVGQYLIVFKCNAASPGEITQIENSVLALRMLK